MFSKDLYMQTCKNKGLCGKGLQDKCIPKHAERGTFFQTEWGSEGLCGKAATGIIIGMNGYTNKYNAKAIYHIEQTRRKTLLVKGKCC